MALELLEVEMLARVEPVGRIGIIGSHQTSAPVDVEAIAADLNAQIVRRADLSDDVSGKVECIGGERFRITVNGRHSPQRQRFTIAHEIAHIVMHTDLIGDGIVDDGLYRSPLGGIVERQANVYAATILMPARLVRDAWRDGVKDYASMSAMFDVSTEVARIRMKELRLG